jgi:hypothetical protein
MVNFRYTAEFPFNACIYAVGETNSAECNYEEKQGGVLINSMDRSPRFAEPPKANRK